MATRRKPSICNDMGAPPLMMARTRPPSRCLTVLKTSMSLMGLACTGSAKGGRAGGEVSREGIGGQRRQSGQGSAGRAERAGQSGQGVCACARACVRDGLGTGGLDTGPPPAHSTRAHSCENVHTPTPHSPRPAHRAASPTPSICPRARKVTPPPQRHTHPAPPHPTRLHTHTRTPTHARSLKQQPHLVVLPSRVHVVLLAQEGPVEDEPPQPAAAVQLLLHMCMATAAGGRGEG